VIKEDVESLRKPHELHKTDYNLEKDPEGAAIAWLPKNHP